MRQAKWVMCPLCESVLYGGPSHFGLDRECECGAVVVRPTTEKGYVLWDGPKLKAAGYDEPLVDWTEEQLSPDDTARPVHSPSISDMYASHMKVELANAPTTNEI